ncbi:MAG: hypothetical protein V4437_02470 [Patescibacteria group bacterium]
MVNLLPQSEKMKLRTFYYARLWSILALLLTVATLAGSAFLMPAYFLARGEADAATRSLAASEENAKLYAATGAMKDVSLLKERLAILKDYESDAVTELILSRLAGDASGDVGISSISVSFSSATAGKVSIAGKAKTRSSLIDFGKKLSDERIFSGVSVPVSDLVNETNLDFSIPFAFTTSAP